MGCILVYIRALYPRARPSPSTLDARPVLFMSVLAWFKDDNLIRILVNERNSNTNQDFDSVLVGRELVNKLYSSCTKKLYKSCILILSLRVYS